MESFLSDIMRFAETIKGNQVQLEPLEQVMFADSTAEMVEHLHNFVRQKEWGGAVGLICDHRTYKVLGKAIEEALDSVEAMIMLPEHVKSDEALCMEIKDRALHASLTCLIAVGSGTINDIGKYVSALTHIPYLCCPTAPSMNGYISRNASIIRQGFRTSVAATLPVGVWVDSAVISKAPLRLVQAGVADVLCRPSVEFDMLLAHYTVGEPYPGEFFAAWQSWEKALYDVLVDCVRSDKNALMVLMQCLLLSGTAMTVTGSSAVASQSEHMLAHTLEMLYASILEKKPLYHGEHIAITTHTMLKRQHALLRQDVLEVLRPNSVEACIKKFGKEVGYQCYHAFEEKLARFSAVENVGCAGQWKRWRHELSDVLVSVEAYESAMQVLGVHYSLSGFGVSQAQYQDALVWARFSRNRVTHLDFFV